MNCLIDKHVDHYQGRLEILSLDFGKSIPDKTLAIAAAEKTWAATLPPFLLGCSLDSTSCAVLIPFPLSISPSAIATSAESL